MWSRCLKVGIALGAVFAAAACGGSSGNSTASTTAGTTGGEKTLTIHTQVITAMPNLPALLAPTYASQFGLKIESATGSNVQDEITAAIRGDVQVFPATPSSLFVAADQNLPLVMVAGLGRGSTQLIAAKSLGVKSGDWAGLKAAVDAAKQQGKKVRFGSPIAASTNYIECYSSLKAHGINADSDLTTTAIQNFPDQPAALIRGNVDLLCTPDPFATITVNSGKGVLFAKPYDTPVGDQLGAIVTTKSTLGDAQKKEAIVRYLKTLNFVIEKLKDHQFALDSVMKAFGMKQAMANQLLQNTTWRLPFTTDELKALAAATYQLHQSKKDWSCCIDQYVDESLLQSAQ